MAEVDPNTGYVPELKSRLEDIKYYTSLFLGSAQIICIFIFLFLIPFILDPAIFTMMHSFVEDPVHCKVCGDTLMARLIAAGQLSRGLYH
jgi:hypothetical protein